MSDPREKALGAPLSEMCIPPPIDAEQLVKDVPSAIERLPPTSTRIFRAPPNPVVLQLVKLVDSVMVNEESEGSVARRAPPFTLERETRLNEQPDSSALAVPAVFSVSFTFRMMRGADVVSISVPDGETLMLVSVSFPSIALNNGF